MKFTDNMKVCWDFLIEMGLSEQGAAGLMGNLYAESGVNPMVLERLCIQRYKERGIIWTDADYTLAVDAGSVSKAEFLNPMGRRYGYGLAQWTVESRKAGLYDYCRKKGKSIGDMRAQLEWLYIELAESFTGVLAALIDSTSVAAASDIVLEKFERPAGWEAQKDTRAGYSMEMYNHFAGSAKRAEGENGTKGGAEVYESEIKICGHGSGKPSVKNMRDYLQQRYQMVASNGKHKGLVAVRRLKGLNATKRQRFHDYYKLILGRNNYDQNRREYCFTAYKDGLYYSDCSSSIIKTYELLGYSFPWTLNTAAIYQSDMFESVPVKITSGHVTNPDVLEVGDCLLFAGNDPTRPLQIGHVEAVYEMPGSGGAPRAEPEKPEYPCWVQSAGKYYWRVADGKNAHGWMIIDGYWYYFGTDGAALAGLHEVKSAEHGTELYYFKDGGNLTCALCHSDGRGALVPWKVK